MYSQESGSSRKRLDGSSILDRSVFAASVDQNPLFSPDQILYRVEERAQSVFRELDKGHQTFGLIHTDLIWKNYFFHETGVGALDFDSCGWGYYLYDLAPTLLGYRDQSVYSELRAGLLTGYRSILDLPARYERYLNTLIAVRHMVSCVWLAGSLDNPDLCQKAPSIVAYRTSEMLDLIE